MPWDPIKQQFYAGPYQEGRGYKLGADGKPTDSLLSDAYSALTERPLAPGEKERLAALQAQGAAAGNFANVGEQGYGAMTAESAAARDYMGRVARGEVSVSGEQLRQGLQQNVAAQRSMAAGAAPQNQAMAARTAAMQSARLGSGMAGQAALAGMQERDAAQKRLAEMIMQQRQQDAQVALQSRSNANTSYGAGQPGQTSPSGLDMVLTAGKTAAEIYAQTHPPVPGKK